MLRIVVVDDEPEIRRVVSEFLTLYMGDVEVVAQAADGVEALETVRLYQPDILLMDVRMPRLDGLQVTRMIKEGGRNDALRIITWSSLVEASLARRALAAGAEQHLPKPFRLSELQAAIQQPVDGASAPEAPPRAAAAS